MGGHRQQGTPRLCDDGGPTLLQEIYRAEHLDLTTECGGRSEYTPVGQARTNPNPAGAVKILGDVWENTANDLGAWSRCFRPMTKRSNRWLCFHTRTPGPSPL